MAARLAHNQEVGGSSPSAAIIVATTIRKSQKQVQATGGPTGGRRHDNYAAGDGSKLPGL